MHIYNGDAEPGRNACNKLMSLGFYSASDGFTEDPSLMTRVGKDKADVINIASDGLFRGRLMHN